MDWQLSRFLSEDAVYSFLLSKILPLMFQFFIFFCENGIESKASPLKILNRQSHYNICFVVKLLRENINIRGSRNDSKAE